MIDKELFRLLGKEKKLIAYVVITMVVTLIVNVGLTADICYAIYLAINNMEVNSYLAPLVIAIICILMRFVLSVISGDLRDNLGRSVKKNLRMVTYDKILTLGDTACDDIGMAGLTQITMEGIEQLDLYFTTYIPQFFYSVTAPIVLFIICSRVDLYPPLVMLCCVPLIPISIVAVSKYAKKVFAKYWGKYISMGDSFLDAVQGLKELKIYQADERYAEKLSSSAEEFRKITMKVLVMQLASTTIMDLIAYGGAGVGIAIATNRMMNGYISPAQALFLMLVAVEFFLPLRAFGSAFHVAMNGASAGKKIIALIDKENPIWSDNAVNGYDIVLDNVSFSYDESRQILDKVNATFNAKGFSAIVGESGSGKSTIVKLLLGGKKFDGSITVGDSSISALSRDDYYKHLAVVSSNTCIFNDTIRANFKLSKEDVTDEEISAALKKVKLDSFITEEGGLDRIINEDSTNISGGQKQRLSLAISLVADKDIYIFDEATSNIDIDSENIIMENIIDMSKSKNVIVISHRLANVVNADVIYCLSNGKVVESGKHDKLIAKNGEYARLYNMQKALENSYKKEVL